MEDLLKNIWTAEESQSFVSCPGAGDVQGGSLQRQGSLTLPGTLSQKTVDEVWKGFQNETDANRNKGFGDGSSFGQRQPTLGEMTLEEFLVKAGVVREENLTNGIGFGTSVTQPQLNSVGFQEPAQSRGVLGKQIVPNAANAMFSAGTTRTNQQNQQQLQHQNLQLPRPLFPKQPTLAFANPMHNTSPVQGNLIQGSHNGGGERSPGVQLSSLSPSPYEFNEGGRGRRACNSIEKVVERRQRRMIKNRESAARSRARKQAYTLELEAEVARLKEINQELRRKQAEFMEVKNQAKAREKMIVAWESESKCLKRTLTGPW